MFKVIVLIAFAVVGAAHAQEAANTEAAPEPYSYGYETDSHAASEQRDASGKVTGFYTLVDADGRQRRVEYIADEAGFRAKVATNEVGTKSENPADVEILASPPTEAQFAAYQTVAAPQQQVVRQQQVVYQQPRLTTTTVAAAPAVSRSSYAVVQQPATTAGYSAQYGSYYQPGYAYGSNYGYAPAGYGYGYGSAYGAGNSGYYSSYSNQLPAQYYRSVTTTAGAPAVSTGAVRYVQTVAQQQPAAISTLGVGNFRTFGAVAPVQGGAQSVTYTTGTRTVGAAPAQGNLLGSSNYLVLKKRAAVARS